MSGPGAYGLVWDQAEIGSGGWQGIEALNFTDPTPAGIAAELRVQLIRPADGLQPGDLLLRGPDGPAPAFTVSVGDGDTVILVRFAQPAAGRLPRGRHRVTLDSGGADPLHPFFAGGVFDFYIDCPAGDCRPDIAPEAPATGPDPAIDMATKDYAGFLKVAQDWVRATDPNWSDLAPASIEATLIEVLAHHAEMLSIHQDRVVQEAFVDTARERISLTRHAAFLGLELDQGRTAGTVVAIDVAQAGYLPAGTPLERREQGGRVTTRFETLDAVFLDPRWNAGLADPADGSGLLAAAWPGAADAVLPAGSTGLLVLGWDRGLAPGQRIALVQGARTHVATLTDLIEFEAPGWAALPSDPPSVAPVQVTQLCWDAPSAVAFQPWSDASGLPLLISANVIGARHGETRIAATDPEAGMIGFGSGRRDLVSASDTATGQVLLRALRTPEGEVLMDPGPPPRPAISLTVGDAAFTWQPNLRTSSGFDRHFSTERDSDGSVWLIFGDGVRGRALPLQGVAIVARYRRGDPAAGNIGAFALNSVGRFPDGDSRNDDIAALAVIATTNITAASGGRRPVSAEVARDLIPESIRHPALERCVTPEDYRRAAETVPGVAQAAAKPLGGIFNTIALLVAPEEGDTLPPELADAVWAHVDGLRMAGREHVVRPPDYVPLDIALLLCPADGAGAGAMRDQARAALVPGTAARPGFFHRSRIGFGAEVRLADILAAVQRQPAIGAVRALAFRPLLDAGPDPVRRAIRLGPTEIAQFAGNDARPDRGRLTLRIQGIDPVDPPAAFVVGGPAPEPAKETTP
ncbi:baseplate J/gp47 family protein [Sedimentitalea sp. JM2-8]|uniref:Baseplate J/gp47 family protein n=1 Tax=Sedimentitalea xiamensis TaxID=3050037 RepID=A0ABT7FEJ2_9RHOB|nr:baseplate J/gp47 family protein [Sedimentitalea xiamensis]MDK3073539.1 baseplate J/gp47 family protein [Sedimentitalea xiamensis]